MQSPKYSGLYVAAQLAKLHKAHFVQSSATPNVSDYSIIKSKAVPIARMTTIAAGKASTEGMVIDLNENTNFRNHRLISDSLLEATTLALQKGEQTMLFINRRGSARVVQCGSCGHIAMCVAKTNGHPANVPVVALPISYTTHQEPKVLSKKYLSFFQRHALLVSIWMFQLKTQSIAN
jgi:hypothetical protein